MQIRETMTSEVRTVSPQASLQEAAQLMAEIDVGALPVEDGDRLVGMITDRDIAVRGVALGKGSDAKVADVMSNEVLYCFDDEEVGEVCANLADLQVRRLPVINREKRLVGIISLADIVGASDSNNAAQALEGITRPGGPHSQSNSEAA